MGWLRLAALAPLAACALPAAAAALTQSSGPIMIGPSVANADPRNNTANLSTMVTNNGDLPDRLVNVSCSPAGDAGLLNGHAREVDGQQQNGLDIPAAFGGRGTPVQVQIGLSKPGVPMANGTMVPCSLYFEHGGQRVVVFMLGEHEQASQEP